MSDLSLSLKQKRHLLISIVSNLMTSILRPFVNDEMKMYYSELVTKFGINTPNSSLTSKIIRDNELGLVFHDKSKSSQKTLKNITDHNQLARHYQQKHMCANYNQILDDGCDSQAILTIIERCPQFDPGLRNACKEVKDKVRNSVSHCNWEEWTKPKYRQCLSMMKSLGSQLPNHYKGEILSHLKKWELNGIKLFKKSVEPKIIKEFVEQASVMIKNMSSLEGRKELNTIIDKEIKDLKETIAQQDSRLSNEIGNLKNEIKDSKFYSCLIVSRARLLHQHNLELQNEIRYLQNKTMDLFHMLEQESGQLDPFDSKKNETEALMEEHGEKGVVDIDEDDKQEFIMFEDNFWKDLGWDD